MNELSGKIFVITGAGSGIGKAIAQLLDSLNVTLILNDINQELMREVAQSLEQSPLCLPFSVAEQNAWHSAKESIDAHFAQPRYAHLNYSGVDGIINNAGIAHDSVAFEDISKEDFERVMDINFYGVLFGTQTFLPELKTKKRAWVVNISSIFGVTSISKLNAYCASKFAVKGLTESLRMEALDSFPHVCVCTVHPGGINTGIASNAIKVEDRDEAERENEINTFNKQLLTSPEKAAKVIVRGISKNSSRVLIGADAKLMDYIARLFPAKYSRILLSQLKKRGLFPS
jgi:butyryl-CoA dehydrogenase